MITSKLGAGLWNAKKIVNNVVLPQFVYRPKNIVLRFGDYRSRCFYARRITGECYDVPQLRLDGYLKFRPPEEELRELIEAGTKRLQERLNDGTELVVTRKDWASLISPADLNPDSIFLRFALNETILNTVAKYFGMAPYLEYVKLLYSVPSERGFVYSQQWHRDLHDVAQIKVFVYIQDVSEENGPFTFFPRKVSRRIPKYKRYIGHASDEYIQRYVSLTNGVAFTGFAGSSLMIDTGICVHMGSRCVKPRLAYTVYYSSGFYLKSPSRPVIAEGARERFSEIQKFALGI